MKIHLEAQSSFQGAEDVTVFLFYQALQVISQVACCLGQDFLEGRGKELVYLQSVPFTMCVSNKVKNKASYRVTVDSACKENEKQGA